jgi:hypothetical protein
MAAENAQLRAAAAAGGGPRRPRRASASKATGQEGEEEEEEEDEQEIFDREARLGYKKAKGTIMQAILDGRVGTAEEYLERDVHLFRLADADLQREYNWYTTVYLGDDTPPPVCSMAERTLIKWIASDCS